MAVDVKRIEELFETCLEMKGALIEIQHAIKTKDHANIVRAATSALEKTSFFEDRIVDEKSADVSNAYRKKGNMYYMEKDYKNTIECYNKALAYAPIGSTEQVVAYSNISAVLLTIKAYQGCQLNIKEARALKCPADVKRKLVKREKETFKFINDEMMRDLLLRFDQDMVKYLNFDVQKNGQISCASKDVAVDEDKNIVAANDISSCTMVAMEKAFVSVQDPYNEFTSCYYCHRIGFIFIPCEGCCKALFCTRECRDKCMEEFHKIECKVVAYPFAYEVPFDSYETSATKMAVRAAIKMSLQMSWEELSAASLEIGKSRLQNSSTKEALDPRSPTSLLCYDDQVSVDRETLIKTSLVCAYALHNLGEVPGYLPEDKQERERAIDALSRIMLNLSTRFLRRLCMFSSATDFSNAKYKCGIQRNLGWFSFASKLDHCCDSNLYVVGLNDHVALVAIKPIKKGEKLTVSFVEHFYEMNYLPGRSIKNAIVRQTLIQRRIQLDCECAACLNKWYEPPQNEASLTPAQKNALKQIPTFHGMEFKKTMKCIGKALDELANEVFTKQHYEAFCHFKCTMNIAQCSHRMNKIYEGVGKYQYFE